MTIPLPLTCTNREKKTRQYEVINMGRVSVGALYCTLAKIYFFRSHVSLSLMSTNKQKITVTVITEYLEVKHQLTCTQMCTMIAHDVSFLCVYTEKNETNCYFWMHKNRKILFNIQVLARRWGKVFLKQFLAV